MARLHRVVTFIPTPKLLVSRISKKENELKLDSACLKGFKRRIGLRERMERLQEHLELENHEIRENCKS